MKEGRKGRVPTVVGRRRGMASTVLMVVGWKKERALVVVGQRRWRASIMAGWRKGGEGGLQRCQDEKKEGRKGSDGGGMEEGMTGRTSIVVG